MRTAHTLRRIFNKRSIDRRRPPTCRPRLEQLEHRRLMTANIGSDFDGDGRTDMAVWRPDNGTWYALTSDSGFDSSQAIRKQWGRSGDVPLKNSDFDADGVNDLAVYRPSNSTWYVLTSRTGFDYRQAMRRQWGKAGDIPLQGSDFDGDGRTDMAVWRPSNGTWYVLGSKTGWNYNYAIRQQWGLSGDVPLQNADFDGDDRADMAVWRPSNGTWYVRQSSHDWASGHEIRIRWGMQGDVPLQNSDFDGDGRTDMAVWRPGTGTWYVLQSRMGFSKSHAIRQQWGLSGDMPLENADFDGDDRADLAVYRPGNATWYVLTSESGYRNAIRTQWGRSQDIPLQNTDFNGDGKTDFAVFRPSDGSWHVRMEESYSSPWGREYVFNNDVTYHWGREGDVPLLHSTSTDTRRRLFVNFDGASLSRAELERWAGTEWSWGADGHSSKIDGDGDGVDVDPFLDGSPNRNQVINQLITYLQADLLPFGISVQRINGDAVEHGGATTVFFGNADLTGGTHIACDIDDGNDNRVDVAFVDEERWAQDWRGDWGGTTGEDYSIQGTALAMADVALHEAGHTWGLVHVDSGSDLETMGLRYNNPVSQWVANTRFIDKEYNKLESSGKQNAFQVMSDWAGHGFSGSPAAPATHVHGYHSPESAAGLAGVLVALAEPLQRDPPSQADAELSDAGEGERLADPLEQLAAAHDLMAALEHQREMDAYFEFEADSDPPSYASYVEALDQIFAAEHCELFAA